MNFAILDAPMAKQIKSLNGKNKDDQLQEQLELYHQFLPLKEAVRAEYRRLKGIDFVSQGALAIEIVGYKMSKQTYDPIAKKIIPPKPILDKNGNPIPIKHRSQRTELSSSYQKNDIDRALISSLILDAKLACGLNDVNAIKKYKQLVLGNKARQKLLLYCQGMVVKLCNQRANLERNNPFWYSELAADLIQYCNLPLSYCVWHYNPVSPLNGKPIKFSSYAFSWIKLGITDYMKSLHGMTETGNNKPVFYTDVKDQDGSYTSIFEVNDLAVSDNTIDYLVEQEESQLNLQKYRVVKKLLTPQELEDLIENKPIVNPFEGTMFEGLASVSPDSKRQKILDKVRQILD